MNDEDVKVYNILRKAKIVTATKFAVTFKEKGIKGINKKFKQRKINRDSGNFEKEKLINLNDLIDYKTNKQLVDVVVDSSLDIERVERALKDNQVDYNLLYLSKKENIAKKIITYKELVRLFSDRAFIWITSKKKTKDNFYFCEKVVFDNNFENSIKELFDKKIESLKLLSNYNNKDCVSVKCSTFFDFMGSNYYSGGAERYLIDLYEIFKKRGINLDIYQNAEKPFFRKYNGINVIGMSLKNEPFDLGAYAYMDKQTKHYASLTSDVSQLHIYSAFFEAYPNCISPSIGISHGIGWDNEGNKNLDAISFWNGKKMIIESAKQCDGLVSVDTNTANWFQTIDYEIGNQKFMVIPNYVDIEEFKPRANYTKVRDKIVIVYPRRLYKPRGVYIALETAEKLVKKYKNIEFHFVGKGFKKETDDIDKLIKKYPKKVFRYSKSPFEMYQVYRDADISLIPTLYSEGTSLSCLEAMASGNLVVSTRIGGLSDLIINGYNGYLIEPNADALYEVLEKVIDNYDEQILIKEKAVDVAKAFNKEIWIEKWNKEIDKFKLKKKSNNIELVEFYVNNISKISDKTFELIKEEIKNKNLVYIRSNKKPSEDNISCGLLQVVDFDDEVVNKAARVYVEKKLKSKIKRKEKTIVME